MDAPQHNASSAVATREALQAAAQVLAAAKALLQQVAGTQTLSPSALQTIERLQTTLTQAIDQTFNGSIEQQLEAVLSCLFCHDKIIAKLL